jgi:hypothetical protein
MRSVRLELPLPRTWMLTVRSLEVSALLVLAAMLLEGWQSWRAAGDYYPPVSADGRPEAATGLQRVVGFVLTGSYGSPVTVLTAGLCVAAAVAVLHLAGPVENARVLRWEVLATGALAATYCLAVVLLAVAATFGDDPYRSQEPGVVSGYRGPTLLERALGVGALPAATVVLLGAAALWWLRLPTDPDDLRRDAGGATAATAAAAAGEPVDARPGVAGQDGAGDGLPLDGVEVIEPVERLRPRDDGGSSSAYDDYLRRF